MPQSMTRKKEYQVEYCARPEIAERRRANFKRWKESNQPHVSAQAAKRRLEKRAMILVANARDRARKRKLPFDLDAHIPEIQARLDLGVCEMTGEPFDFTPGRKFNSPSIDRVVPSAGYIYGNIRVVLYLMNCAMGNWGEEALLRVAGKWTAMQSVSRRRKRSLKRG